MQIFFIIFIKQYKQLFCRLFGTSAGGIHAAFVQKVSAVFYYMVQGKIYKTDIRFFLILYKPLSQMVYGGIFVKILRVGIFSAVEQIEMIATEIFAFAHMVRTFF